MLILALFMMSEGKGYLMSFIIEVYYPAMVYV